MIIWKYKDRSYKENWHKWFAWHPVCTEDDMVVFLEYVWRKGNYEADDDCGWLYDYRRLTE